MATADLTLEQMNHFERTGVLPIAFSLIAEVNQVLDYAEFLASKYGERGRPANIFAKLTETVEDTLRAGKLPIQAITGTMGLMDGAAKVMRGLADANCRGPRRRPLGSLADDPRRLSARRRRLLGATACRSAGHARAEGSAD